MIKEALDRAMTDHDLSGIGVNIFSGISGMVTVYVHWADSDGFCASGSAKTFEDALAIAVEDMGGKRIVVPSSRHEASMGLGRV